MTTISICSSINEILPTEILGLVFEGHTRLELNTIISAQTFCIVKCFFGSLQDGPQPGVLQFNDGREVYGLGRTDGMAVVLQYWSAG